MGKLLSTADEKFIKDHIDAVIGKRINELSQTPPKLDDEFEGHQAPETYIAKPQELEGIPALDPDTGEPGKGACDIYRVYETSGGTPELLPVANFELQAHNISLQGIPEEFIQLTRDKYGDWLITAVLENLSGGSVRMIHGLTTSSVATTDTTFFIDNIVAVYGSNPTLDSAETIEVQNDFKWNANSGAHVMAVFCNEDILWEAIQVECP